MDRDEVLRRVELTDLLDALSGPPGPNRRWRCPDPGHPDEHPSVTVRVDQSGVQRWRCWSGGHRGTAVDAVMVAHHVDVGEALRWLDEHYANLPPLHRPPPPPAAPPGRPHQAVLDYVDRSSKLLWTPAGEPQRAWLAERGLGSDVLRVNRVGADPGRRYLPRPDKGFPPGWPAVVYPALDPAGDVTYFQARYLTPQEHRSKYDNPAACHAANPRVSWTVPVGTPRPGLVVACEGVGDALIAAQAGFRSVAVLGADYPDARVVDAIVLAVKGSSALAGATVVVCFDGDEAGRRGGARLVELLTERAVATAVVAVADGLDLTGWAGQDHGWVSAFEPFKAAPVASRCLRSDSAPGVELGIGLSLGGPW
ncbi:MAG: toprim domain-containing protein [Ilumatobacteraceae bacterium]